MKKLAFIIAIVFTFVSCYGPAEAHPDNEGTSIIFGFFLIFTALIISMIIRSNSVTRPRKIEAGSKRKEAILEFIGRALKGTESLCYLVGIPYFRLDTDKKKYSGASIYCTDKAVYFCGQYFRFNGLKRNLVLSNSKRIKLKEIDSVDFESKKAIGWLIFLILFILWAINPIILMLKEWSFAPELLGLSFFWTSMSIIFFRIYKIKRRKYFVIKSGFEKIGVPVKWYEEEELINLANKVKRGMEKRKK